MFLTNFTQFLEILFNLSCREKKRKFKKNFEKAEEWPTENTVLPDLLTLFFVWKI